MTLPTFFLLDGLTDEQRHACCRQADLTPRSYAKGETIFDSARSRPALAFLTDGTARVYHGRVVMNELYPGDCFGAAAMFGATEPYVSRVEAATSCTVLFLSQETVRSWMEQYPAVAENYIRFLSDRIRFLNRRLAALTAGGAESKLWRDLCARADETGTVPLPGGMTALAKSLNMSRSSLYRSLDTLEQAGLLSRQPKKIVIHPERKN